MTYLQFHLVFILPPLLFLWYRMRGATAVLGPRVRWTLPVMALIALAWTTPWDNYLVWRGVWWYGADRVLATIGYVPVEEYLFFILQPLLVGLWCCHVLTTDARRWPGPHETRGDDADPSGFAATGVRAGTTWSPSAAGLIVYANLSIAGAAMLVFERSLYLGLILAWAAPVLLGQWVLVGRHLGARPRLFLRLIVAPTLYLWVADRIAIGVGIWSIAPQYTTGLHLLGLPIEEAAFFLVTNLLVVQGVLLFLQPWQRQAVQQPMRMAA
ncbi:MAG TPA: lycopene cyclase domain-containing protein [Longimicrobiales bacterium]|nr:lycopene cyclase domain-containing protein [Longimicrobiales bacterium]